MSQLSLPATDPRDPVRRKLRAAWRRDRLSVHLRGVAWAVLIAAPAAVVLFAVDWLLRLPAAARWALLAIAAGVLVWQLSRRWWSRLRRYDPLSWAGRVERVFPQLNSLLLSYVDLTRPQPAATGSSELFARVRGQAADAAAPLDFARAVRVAGLRPLLMKAAAAALVVAALAAVFPAHAAAAVRRYLGADIDYPTATRFVSVTGDRTIARGAAVGLDAEVRGRVPDRGRVWVRPDGGDWRSVALDRDEAGTFAYAIDHATTTFDFYFEIGDARSPRRGRHHRVTVIPPPTIVGQHVRVTPPAYTGVEPFDLPTLAGRVPARSAVDLTATTDRPLAGAALVLPEGSRRPGAIGEDRRTARFAFTPSASGVHRLELVGAELRGTSTSEPFQLRLLEDQPPTASLIEPTADLKATTQKRLGLTVRAADDYGLADMAIVFRVGEDGARQRVPLGPPPVPDAQDSLALPRSGQWPLSWQINEDIPHLAPGDRLRVAVEVTEVAPEGQPGRTAVTQERTVEVLSKAEYQAHIVARLEALRRRVGETERAEQIIRHEVDAILKRTGGSAQDTDSTQEVEP